MGGRETESIIKDGMNAIRPTKSRRTSGQVKRSQIELEGWRRRREALDVIQNSGKRMGRRKRDGQSGMRSEFHIHIETLSHTSARARAHIQAQAHTRTHTHTHRHTHKHTLPLSFSLFQTNSNNKEKQNINKVCEVRRDSLVGENEP